MKKVNAISKRGSEFINAYEKAKYTSVNQCYLNPSQRKRIAEMQCKATMVDTGGYDFRILSFNTMQFTCGWTTASGNIRIETAMNSYLIEMPF